ncbi:helix-turn-helix domain-containing protein [Actinophytocola sp.]|jgi:DNA-binding transcriptional ArsR family regulator|uniref:helix-turn-helix domain-containing protein n=1 Tax=Actinophytocola sp. TaxID=1872138 RepID=UPI003899C984
MFANDIRCENILLVETSELLVHPVRLRIVHALSGEPMTTAQLCTRLPDVSQATVYRHVGVLADAGVLEVSGEQRVRGTVERTYRLRKEKATIDAETAAAATVDDHRQAFTVAMATLIAEFTAYLNGDANPAEDLVGYRQHAVWLTHEELEALITDLRTAILPRLRNTPAPGRRQHLLSPILFPTVKLLDEPT